MKHKYLTIVLLSVLAFIVITSSYYLSHGYKITFIAKNNITKSANASSLHDTLLPVGYLEYDQNKEYWGYINTSGDVVIALTYDKTYGFDENYLAVVKKNQQYGLINTEGQYILPLQYKIIQYMGQGIYYYADDTSGHLANFNSTYQTLNVFNDVTYDKVGHFTDTLAFVVKDNKLGYITKAGVVKIPLQYDYKDDFDFNFYNGYAFIDENNKFGLINTNGLSIITPQLDEVLNSYQLKLDYKEVDYTGLAIIPYRQGDLWGYMNQNGTILVQPQFLEAYPFTDSNLARVQLSDKTYTYINKEGQLATTNTYTDASDFYNGYADVSTGIKQYGLINATFETIVALENDYVGSVNQNNVLIINDMQSKYVNVLTNAKLDISYHVGDDITDCHVILASDDPVSVASRTFVILNQAGNRIVNEVTPKSYKEIEYIGKTYIQLVAYEKASNLEYYTYIDDTGHLLWKVYK